MSTSAANQIMSSQLNTSHNRFTNSTELRNYWRDSPFNGPIPRDGSRNNQQNEIKNKVLVIKKKFHQDRQLFVKHLPRNVTRDEIGNLLKDFRLRNINIISSDDTSSTAVVTLENPEMLDGWDDENTFLLRGQNISVSPTDTDMLLCVARLPFSYTEEDFYKLINVYGDIKMYFLMISENTGKSKGYGFVRYVKKDNSLTARNCLNDKIIDAFQLVCDWLDSSHLTFASLNSKCLYVDKLPKGFKDMCEFRNIFSKVIHPPYCQIALKNGCLQDWGLVEYRTSEDAELVQTSLNGFCYKDHEIRVMYYIPGVRAINLYLQLLNDTGLQGKSTGLLPEPSGQSVIMSIQNLSKQNPIFAQNLRNIIMNQIQETQSGKDPFEDEKHSCNGKTKKLLGANTTSGLTNGNGLVLQSTPMVLNNISGHPAFLQSAAQGFPLMPNTTIPPPMMENLSVPPGLNSIPPLNLQNKSSHCLSPQSYWNDVLSQMISNGTYTPFAAQSGFQENSPQGVLFPPTPISPPFVSDINSVNFSQNLLNIFNAPSSVPQVYPSLPNLGQVAPPHGIFTYAPLPVDPSIVFTGPGAIIPGAIHQPVLNTYPVVNPKLLPNSWTPVQTMVSSNIPAAFTNAAEWAPFVSNANVMQHPNTPVMQQQMGLKRKILPSPEASPEGNYIGQHSQGIGGHYADSYFKKTKTQ